MSLSASYWTPARRAERSDLNISALYFCDRGGLMASTRTTGNQRRYPRDTVRRLAFIRAAARVGVPLAEMRAALVGLPVGRTVTAADWARLLENWHAELDDRMATLTRPRDDLVGGIRGEIPW